MVKTVKHFKIILFKKLRNKKHITLGSAPSILQVLTVDHSCMFFPMNRFQVKTFYSFGNHGYFMIFPCLGIHIYNS